MKNNSLIPATNMSTRIHPSAEVSQKAEIGDGCSIWHHSQVREGAHLGRNCILGKGVYIDAGVWIGDNVKIQNYVSVFHGVTIADGAFIGPHVCFTNDLYPRAINPNGSPKDVNDWVLTPTRVGYGAALGANSVIVCGVNIGDWAMVAAGSTVSRDVPPFGLVRGNPARLKAFVCPCGGRLGARIEIVPPPIGVIGHFANLVCTECGMEFEIPMEQWLRLERKEPRS